MDVARWMYTQFDDLFYFALALAIEGKENEGKGGLVVAAISKRWDLRLEHYSEPGLS